MTEQFPYSALPKKPSKLARIVALENELRLRDAQVWELTTERAKLLEHIARLESTQVKFFKQPTDRFKDGVQIPDSTLALIATSCYEEGDSNAGQPTYAARLAIALIAARERIIELENAK